MRNKAFYEKVWFTVLMLFVFFPVGLLLMWRYKQFDKVLRIIITIVFITFFIGRIDTLSSNMDDSKDLIEIEDSTITEVQYTDERAFKEYASNMTGQSFVKEISLRENDANVTFYANFEEYKEAKPDSNITDELYTAYFNTGDAVEKILVGEPVRLLKEFPTLDTVSMRLFNNGSEYSTILSRESANEFLGFDVKELSDDESWREMFSNKYIHTDKYRKEFYQHFITVK